MVGTEERDAQRGHGHLHGTRVLLHRGAPEYRSLGRLWGSGFFGTDGMGVGCMDVGHRKIASAQRPTIAMFFFFPDGRWSGCFCTKGAR